LKNNIEIVFHNELAMLVIDESSKATQGLNKFLPNNKTPFDSFQLFWPTHLLKRFLIMINKYAILESEGGGTRGGLN